jgi:ribosomal protection tetracycline resistance protein
VTVVDTPGHPDFIAEVERSIGVLDAAVLVVSAVEGVQSQTVRIWRVLRRAGVPTLLFVNKVDRAGSDPAAVTAQLADHLTDALVPLTDVENEGTKAVTVVLHDLSSEPVVSALAAIDDGILQAWVEGRPPTRRKLRRALRSGIASMRATPVLHGSALTGSGIETLLAILPEFTPQPADPDAEAAATVFAIDRDERGQRRTWLRMWQGRIAARSRVRLGARHPQVVTGLWVSTRDGIAPRDEIRAGEVGAVTGLVGSRIGDTIGAGSLRPSPRFPPATVRALVEPVDPAERGRAYQGLQELADEDPLIDLDLSEMDQEAAVSLYGEVQQEVIAAVLEDRFGVRVRFTAASVVCVERVLGAAEAVERIGENGNPYLAGLGLRIEPTPEGTGTSFSPGRERGNLPASLVAATEEGARRALRAGRFGWAVTDCRITMTSSQYWPRQSHAHQKFNKAMSTVAADFRHLAPVVLHAALARAGTRVCQPVDAFELEVPEAALPAVLAAFGQLGARVTGTQTGPGRVHLTGIIRSADVHRFSRDLPDLTSGHGILTTGFHRYEAIDGDEPPTRTRRGPDPLDRAGWFRAHPR